MSESGSRLYDDPALAAAYARVSAANTMNAAYERPALRALLGEVAGRDVLDAGCAGGEHAAWLVEHGARVVALDASAAMVDLARERVGTAAQVVQADLGAPLPFADASFDLVASSLTLHYLADWNAPLRELARVLRPGGRLVFSTHHPLLTVDDAHDYRAVRLVDDVWPGFAAEPVPVRFYHRSLERIVGDVLAAGFTLHALVEPGPSERMAERDPAMAARLRTQPWFLLVDASR
ncbi:MAG TPA: class I SAM-dependent methyltransferase [Candidatus Limnocylindria bacterium]|jgi:SAM-dependent methyltransferase|nr:class I SAM-dependent methyltransferase [Candidatus Limnocylindria bacterium]